MKKNRIIIGFLLLSFIFFRYYEQINNYVKQFLAPQVSYSIDEIPKYTGEEYVVINDNIPFFEKNEITTKSFEKYGNLDYLNRATTAFVNVSLSTMPSEERGSIGMIKPSGWHTVKYEHISGKYLYNRCHLIGYQLTGENANEKNLITCTRQMNTGIMLEYENNIAAYVRETSNHVLYRVTPIYKDKDLLASGIQMEGLSVEDNGKGIKFNIYIYNVQDGVDINYTNGENKLSIKK